MKKLLMWVSFILGLAFLYVSYFYLTHAAGNLPAFMPGYLAGSQTIHYKHSIAALLLGIACFVFAWFQSGKKKSTT